MARPSSIEDEELIARLSEVFQNVGYEGASLAMLSEATGLQRASLYHRFPGGKQQMAEEVLSTAIEWTVQNVVAPLTGEGNLRERWSMVRRSIDKLYGAGRKSCLLNMLMAPRNMGGPFAKTIQSAFTTLIDAFARFAREAGHSDRDARQIGQRAVMLIQGSLVLARGLRDPRPFKEVLVSLEGELMPAHAGDR